MLRTDHIVDVLKRDIGEPLRFVGFSDDDYEILYIRDDVNTRYAGMDVQEIYDEYRSSRLASPYLENVWNVGEHYSTIYAFDDALICQFIIDGTELIVSIDADGEFDLTTVMDKCKNALENDEI